MEFIGRLHPLIVHLPIGILLLAAFLEVWSRFRGKKNLRPAVDISVTVGSLTAVAACISGLVLSEESGYDEQLLFQHKIVGITTAAFSVLLVWIFFTKKLFNKKRRKNIRLIAFFPLVILIFITGHLGGSLTHGTDFLFSMLEDTKDSISNTNQISFDADPNIYAQLVKPLLEEKCYDCHSSKKQKGKLRLDGEEWILKGGKNGSILNTLNQEESEMLRRINLPIEDEDHMPPRKKTQLSSGELDVIKNWILSGASFTKTLSEVEDSLVYVNYINSVSAQDLSTEKWWPEDKIDEADKNILEALSNEGISINALADENNYLQVSFVMYDTFPSNIWNNLNKVKNNIASLRLSDVKLSTSDWDNLSTYKNLRKLYLDRSTLDDTSIGNILSLDNLTSLNLSYDSISDVSLKKLVALKSLEQLILFETSCTAQAVKVFKESLPGCSVEFNQYKLPFLVTDTLEYRRK